MTISEAKVLLINSSHIGREVEEILQSLDADHFRTLCISDFPIKEDDLVFKGSDRTTEGFADVVLINLGEDPCAGFAMTPKLRDSIIPDNTPIIYVYAKHDADLILKGYQTGADDYVLKPIDSKVLKAKIERAKEVSQTKQQLSCELTDTRKMAMDAISLSGELGQLIHFFDDIITCSDYEAASMLLLDVLAEYDLKASLKLYVQTGDAYFSSEGLFSQVEGEVIDMVRGQGRIYDFQHRTIFNYPHLSLLVKNMPPIESNDNGKVKDNLCLFLNVMESKITAIETAEKNEAQNNKIVTTACVIKQIVHDIEKSNVETAESFEKVIIDLESTVQQDVTRFNLLHDEEESLLRDIHIAITQASKIFEDSLKKEGMYRAVLNQLVSSLDQ